MNGRSGVIAAGLLGALGVAAGAFGAHALRGTIDGRSLEIWQTAAHYQQVHAAALLGAALWAMREPRPLRRLAIALFTAGIVVFAGALYPLALGGPKILGALAPFGGMCLIGGWLSLAIEGLKLPR
ncbi:MAG: DUF423 domain-containing protein [Myxococcales bacterium]|nr:DUF423 domain-containing protein [Myxococcales bacterium]